MNRAKSEKYLYSVLDKITGTKDNSNMWRKRLSKLSDKQYKEVLKRWISGKDKLHIIVPNNTNIKLNTKVCLELADEIGFKFFERLHIPATDTDPAYITAVPHLITTGPIKRQSQTLAKKISLTSDDKHVDLLTQQPRGDSDSASISYPELQLLAQVGLSTTATEFVKTRGGDAGAYRAMVAQLEATGSFDQNTAMKYSTGAQSKQTLRAYLNAMHINTNF